MAERAVLARRRADGRYDLARSRWGGTDRALGRVLAGTPPDRLPDVDWRPWRSGVGFPTLVGTLDFLATSVCYRVAAETTAFLALWFGLPLPEESASRTAGALLEVVSSADARRVRRRFRELKGTLADAIIAGTLPAAVAALVLSTWVGTLAGRESHLAPAFRFPAED